MNDASSIRKLVKAHLIASLIIQSATILATIWIFNISVLKIEIATDTITKQPQYDISSMQRQMDDITKFIVDHNEREKEFVKKAELLNKQLELSKLQLIKK